MVLGYLFFLLFCLEGGGWGGGGGGGVIGVVGKNIIVCSGFSDKRHAV